MKVKPSDVSDYCLSYTIYYMYYVYFGGAMDFWMFTFHCIVSLSQFTPDSLSQLWYLATTWYPGNWALLQSDRRTDTGNVVATGLLGCIPCMYVWHHRRCGCRCPIKDVGVVAGEVVHNRSLYHSCVSLDACSFNATIPALCTQLVFFVNEMTSLLHHSSTEWLSARYSTLRPRSHTCWRTARNPRQAV